MFDEVECEWPLEQGHNALGFQTKDFACLLETYRIGSDGIVRCLGARGLDGLHFTFYTLDQHRDWIEYRAFYEMRVTRIERIPDEESLHPTTRSASYGDSDHPTTRESLDNSERMAPAASRSVAPARNAELRQQIAEIVDRVCYVNAKPDERFNGACYRVADEVLELLDTPSTDSAVRKDSQR